MKDKLLFVIPELSRKTTGHYWHIYEMLQEAAKKIDLVLFAENGSEVARGNIREIYWQKFKFLPLRIIERVSFFVVYALKGYRKFYIHQSIYTSLIATLLGKILKLSVFYWHCGMMHLYEQEEGQKNWIFRLNLKLIDYLVTAHPEIKRYYRRHFGVIAKKIKILPAWVNIERLQMRDQKKEKKLRKKLRLNEKKVVLFIHWLSPRKGSRFLPDIVANSVKIKNDIVFVIVGDGPDLQWLRKEFARRKMADNVRLVGRVANVDIAPHLHIADVFILPSREEELGRVQLEAMAARKPIVAFTTMGSRYLLRSYPYATIVAPVGNISGFTAAIGKSLRDEQKISSQKRQLEKFSHKQVAKAFIRMIAEANKK